MNASPSRLERPVLRCASDPAWLPQALARFDQVLVDHAHCEKKAAGQAISLLAGFPEKELLVQRMARLAQEEIGHFRQVYDRMLARGLSLGRDRGDPYARRLRKLVRHERDDTRLTDLLLVSALIEARSHERLQLLSEGLSDPDLAQFYAGLAQAEHGHALLFVELAATYAPEDEVVARLEVMGEAEAEIVRALPLEPRIH
ncbi:MAG: tRNA-(ms[2]io[6]A)-hydroxylase [Planctomycetes bacterium]|nr:tRNA-(ms[2]io[6]A)-hydroxylase [Planctomycetota bacterium]